MNENRKLTPKQERFCREYLIDLNATQAAIRAGYSKNRASELGYQLLHKTTVSNRVRELKEKKEIKLDISAERILLEMQRLAFSDTREIYDEDGNLKPIHELSDDAAATLAGIETDEVMVDGKKQAKVRKVKRWSKEKALEMLAKYKNLLKDETKQIFEGDIVVQIGDRPPIENE